MAQFADLIGIGTMSIGHLTESHAWFHTARLAAGETGDRPLRAWVMALDGLVCFWDTALAHRGLRQCQSARAVASPNCAPAGALAAGIQARFHARLGQRREAVTAIRQAETMFDRPAAAPRSASSANLRPGRRSPKPSA